MRPILRALACVALFSVTACAHEYPFVWVDQLRDETGLQTVQPGDTLTVLIRNQQQLSGEFVVRVNGTYLQPLVGEILVAGLTPEEVRERLVGQLQGIIVQPEVSISVSTPRPLSISVLGEVRSQGNYTIPFGEGIMGALARAGGLTEFADKERIFVLREWPKRVRIRFNYEDLTTGEVKSNAFKLRDRDVVVVE